MSKRFYRQWRWLIDYELQTRNTVWIQNFGNLFLILGDEKNGKIKYSRESEFIHNTVPYPTVFRWKFYHARGHFARGAPYFLPKFLRFSAKKVKSANRTEIKTVLAFWLIYFKSANRSAIILIQINSKK
jgi:hypothetical protein